jgi:hypothetical protein
MAMLSRICDMIRADAVSPAQRLRVSKTGPRTADGMVVMRIATWAGDGDNALASKKNVPGSFDEKSPVTFYYSINLSNEQALNPQSFILQPQHMKAESIPPQAPRLP